MMKKTQVAAAVALALSSVSFAHQAVQWKVSDGGNGHWYQATSIRFRNFAAAQTFAVQAGGHLVTLTSEGENGFVSAMATGEFLLGGFQDLSSQGYSEPSGGWKWVTGEPWQFTRWRAGEPNNNGQIDANAASEQYLLWWRFGMPANDEWNDGFNDATAEFSWDIRAIIEWSADCNNDGVVDYGQCRDGSLPDYDGNNIPDCCESGTACVVGNYPVQWRVEDSGNGHWYQVRQLTTDCWDQSRLLAQGSGGYLATIASAGENQLIHLIVQAFYGSDVSIGGYYDFESNSWRWVSGETWQYSNWQAGEPGCCLPNEWWLDFNMVSGEWRDRIQCIDPPQPFPAVALFEWSADCNNDGIVDYGQILTGQLADSNSNGIPDSCETVTCRDADFFPDRNVNGADLGILLAQWGPATQYTVADLNRDGTVDGADLGIVLSFWGPCPY